MKDWGPTSSPKKERNKDGKTRETNEDLTVGCFLSIFNLMSVMSAHVT